MNDLNSRLSDSSLGQRPGGRHLRDPALKLLRPPPSLRLATASLVLVSLLLIPVMLLVPWQQSAMGTGRVIAMAPAERQQVVDAPVSGRIAQWLVTEGQRVEVGDPLVQVLDNDPDLVNRLDDQRLATMNERGAVEQQIRSYSAKMEALSASRDLVVAEYDSKIQKLRQERVSDEADLDAAQRNHTRLSTLADEGIASERDRELATAKLQSARAKIQARDAEITAMRRAQEKAAAEVRSKLASAEAELEVARTKMAQVDGKVVDLDVKTSRQASQLVTAPRAGTVLRFYGGPGGGQIKKGEPLLTLVPDADSRAVELWVDGNDMPFVRPGEQVRLVFEGWPALQFVGLAGASRGTFGGQVSFIDATDDGKGQFRVVVVPEDEPWPDPAVLRQGVRTKGFVLLGTVPLGVELWRQLNGFPPVPPVEKGDTPLLPTNKKPRTPAGLK